MVIMNSDEWTTWVESRIQDYKTKIKNLKDFVEVGGHFADIKQFQNHLDFILLSIMEDTTFTTEVLMSKKVFVSVKDMARDFLKMLESLRWSLQIYVSTFIK